ncbi:hypothetical protein VPH35_027057 [Triticum aestivum]
MACSSLKFDHVEDLSRGTRDNNEKSRDGCVAQGCTPRCSSVQCRTRVVEVHLLHCCMFTCGHTLIFILSVCSYAVEGVLLITGVCYGDSTAVSSLVQVLYCMNPPSLSPFSFLMCVGPRVCRAVGLHAVLRTPLLLATSTSVLRCLTLHLHLLFVEFCFHLMATSAGSLGCSSVGSSMKYGGT